MGRDEHARDLELERDVAGEQRPGAAGRDEREVARVVAAADRVQLDRLRHPEALHLQHVERRLGDSDSPSGSATSRIARSASSTVERHRSAEKSLGAQAAEQELRVGRRRLSPPRP